MLLAQHVTPAKEQERVQVETLAKAVQDVTDGHVEPALVDQGYTGEEPAKAAQEQGITIELRSCHRDVQGVRQGVRDERAVLLLGRLLQLEIRGGRKPSPDLETRLL